MQALETRLQAEQEGAAAEASGQQQQQQQQQQQAGASQRMVAVVHTAPAAVARSATYQSFMRRFGPGAHHMLVAADGQAGTTCQAAATLQTKLNMLDPTIFPLGAIAAAAAAAPPPDASQPPPNPAAVAVAAAAASAGDGGGAVILRDAPHMTRLTLTPAKQRGLSPVDIPAPLQLAALRQGLLPAHPRVAALLQQFQASRAALLSALLSGGGGSGGNGSGDAAAAAAAAVPAALRGLARDVFELVFLGTVSAVPSSYRNVSSYYMDFFERGGALADVGE